MRKKFGIAQTKEDFIKQVRLIQLIQTNTLVSVQARKDLDALYQKWDQGVA